MKFFQTSFVLLLLMGILSTSVLAHEIVGQVTPLMIHMRRALLLIENKKGPEGVDEIHRIYEDFSHDMGMGMTMEGVGLKITARQIDRKFGTQLEVFLSEAMDKKDSLRLQKGVQSLALLLMLEKFDALQGTFAHPPINMDVQKTIFWLGRNYFSYLLEPTLAQRDPVEAKRLDRLLDRMLYRLEDNQPRALILLKKEVEQGIIAALHLSMQASGGLEKE